MFTFVKNKYLAYKNKSEIGKIKIIGHKNIYFGKNLKIRDSTLFQAINNASKNEKKIHIEDNCYIGQFCQINSGGYIEIKKNCVLSDYVYINDMAHGLNPNDGDIMNQQVTIKGSIIIGESTFIGYGCIILSGVEIGAHAVVGAGSVVTKSFPEYSMIAGNPAKKIGYFDENLNSWIKYENK